MFFYYLVLLELCQKNFYIKHRSSKTIIQKQNVVSVCSFKSFPRLPDSFSGHSQNVPNFAHKRISVLGLHTHEIYS